MLQETESGHVQQELPKLWHYAWYGLILIIVLYYSMKRLLLNYFSHQFLDQFFSLLLFWCQIFQVEYKGNYAMLSKYSIFRKMLGKSQCKNYTNGRIKTEWRDYGTIYNLRKVRGRKSTDEDWSPGLEAIYK